LAQGKLWVEAPETAAALGREKARIEAIVRPIDSASRTLTESAELLEMAEAEGDEAVADDIAGELADVEAHLQALEFQRMFSGEADAHNAFMDIQAGSGGTEAQDWAEMLLRMYLRWCEHRGFSTEVTEVSGGDVAGIKSATVAVAGDYAYGWLRTETGVHRLVRKSPFDSGARRHTSFAAVFVAPEIDDDIAIDIDPSDLRVDVYRASGAGGQHVNRTESAVRITHLPTNIVVQCQNDRSQHKNRATAMKQLRAKLYEREMAKRRAVAAATEADKADIGWGSQIRSYVLDASRIKDLRTGVEVGNTQAVLNGDLDAFVEASLKQGF
jgi:peptide chain release factor 2